MMGRRSEFERIPKDLYETWDPKAVVPLLTHLPPHTKYSEPCVGKFALVDQLDSRGHKCVWASDIEDRNTPITVKGHWVHRTITEIDALMVTTPLSTADCIITNPPWSREILHPLIEHFRKHNKAWILLDSAWAFTKQSSEYMKYCSKIVAVGRLKWIPGTKMSGKDDCSWYCMEMHPCETIFHGR